MIINIDLKERPYLLRVHSTRWPLQAEVLKDARRNGAGPIMFYALCGVCWQPWIKGLTIMVTNIFNGNRREDIWLDR